MPSRGAHPRSSSVIGLEVVRMMEAVVRQGPGGARESRFETIEATIHSEPFQSTMRE